MKKEENKKLNKKQSKEEKKANKIAKKAKDGTKNFFKGFKAFISRGNIVDMSTGVIIGGAFGAMVTALTGIFLSVCTWAVPGGLKGLITVLPAANESQQGMAGIGQTFSINSLDEIARNLAMQTYGSQDPQLIETMKASITSKYTLYGSTYVFNGSAVIDWGTFINAIITFIIIALVLFLIIRGIVLLQNAKKAAQQKLLEEYYKKHPEARPAKVVEAADPTEKDLLKAILLEMKTNNTNLNKKKKKE